MNFLSMDYFVTLAQERNFTRAAEKLHITQQTLSAHIAALEKEAGSPFFVRHAPLELTYAGRVFLRYAQDFRKSVRSLQQELNDIALEEKGELRIGTAPVRERALLPELITRFLKKHPHIRFVLTEATNQVLQEKLLNGEIDIAVASFPKTVPGVELIPYYEEEFVLLVSERLLGQTRSSAQGGSTAERRQPPRSGAQQGDLDIPLRITKDLPAAIKACPFLLNSKHSIAGRIAWNLFRQNGFRPDIRIESDNMETLLELCAAGNGAMICSEMLARKALTESQLAAMRIIPFAEPVRYTIFLGCRKEPHRWRILDSFIQTALAHNPAAL